MQLKANVIICDNCHCKLDKESIAIKRKNANIEGKRIEVTYFKCIHCGKPYITEVVMPIGHFKNIGEQVDDIPDELKIVEEE